MLILVTLLWGLSFPWMKEWQLAAGACPGGNLLASLTLIGLRMTLALIVFTIFRPRLVFGATPREHAAGATVGAIFVAGFVLQVWGLAYTTPALSGFFTSLACAWAPLLAWLLFRDHLSGWTLAGLALGLAGTVAFVEGDLRLRFGEALGVVASYAFAGQMLSLDRLGRVARPGRLTAGFFAAPGMLALAGALVVAATGPGLDAWFAWTLALLRDPAALRTLACLTLLPTVLSFHWMNVWQPRVGTSRAALIYLLEPVFASAFSIYLGYDKVTIPLLLGGTLILGGNLLVELPGLLARKEGKP